MKDLSWIKILLLSVSIIIAGYFVGNMHKTGKIYDRTVTVKGLSEREVNADIAVWPINIRLAGNDLGIIKSELDQQNNEVLSFFKNLGFPDNELSLGITNIVDTRVDVYSADAYRPFRYIATSDFTIRTGDIQKLQTALASSLELVSKGIVLSSKNSWEPIEYSFTGLNDIKPEMIEEATKNAREVAEKFAKDSNSKVGKIRKADQGLFSIRNRDQNTQHIKIVRVVSTIDYQLED